MKKPKAKKRPPILEMVVLIMLVAIVGVSTYFSPLGKLGLANTLQNVFTFACAVVVYFFFGLDIKGRLRNWVTPCFMMAIAYLIFGPWVYYDPPDGGSAVIIQGKEVTPITHHWFPLQGDYHWPNATIVPFPSVFAKDDSSRVSAEFVVDSANVLVVYDTFKNKDAFKTFVKQKFHESLADFFKRNPYLTNRCCLRCVLTTDSIKVAFTKTDNLSFY